MDQYIYILNMISKNQLPESFDVDSKELNIILNLIDEELISANLQPVYGSTFINSPRLTIKGEEKLKASKLSTKTISAFHNVSFGIWKSILYIIASIIIAFLVNYLYPKV
ncbi:MAG: hypothetical protein HQK72_08960 [Desulfamplus sp.]|nr:hypothetical protein [Desulfamplus sp.]